MRRTTGLKSFPLGCALAFVLASASVQAQQNLTPPASTPATPKAEKTVKPKTPPATPPAKSDVKGARIPVPGPAESPLFGAREFEDSRSGLQMTVPPGWFVVESPKLRESEISLMRMDGPGAPPPSCMVSVILPKQPGKITQAMLNKIMHDDRNVNNIRATLSRDGRKLNGVSKITQDGVNGLRAQMSMPANAQRPELTQIVSFFETVGRRFTFECGVLSADMDAMSKDIDVIIKSVRFGSK